MATRLARPAIAGALTSLTGVVLALATLALTILDRNSPPFQALAGLSRDWSLAATTAVQTAGLVTLSVVAGVVLWRQPGNRFSRALVPSVLLLALLVFAGEYAVHGLVVDPGSLPLADAAARSQILLPPFVLLGALLVILLFPDGRLRLVRGKVLLGAAAIVLGAQLVANLDDPSPIGVGLIAKQVVPVTVPPELWPAGAAMNWASAVLPWARVALIIVVAAAILLRLAASHGERRLQLKWFTYAGAFFFLTGLLGYIYGLPLPGWLPFADFTSSDTASAISAWGGLGQGLSGMVLLPAAIGFAILRYRLYDIDVVISRTVLYGGLAAFVAAIYGIVVAGAGSLLGQRAGFSPVLTLLAIALAAAMLEPVRSRLQRLANVAVYGRRATPYQVLSDFVRSVGGAEASDVLLPRMADFLREGTGAVAVEVWVRIGERLQLAATSPPGAPARTTVKHIDELRSRIGLVWAVEPVLHEAELLGALTLRRSRGDQITPTDRHLLEGLASQAGLVFSRFRLVEELRESRARIVVGQDLERQRIQRNLHDGAQQRFVNALLALGLAQTDQSGGSRALLETVTTEVKAGLADLRNLARGLHPPLLTESGLHAAIVSLAERAPIIANVARAPDRRYAEAVEVTAYYIVAEALANAAKHSGASNVDVRIEEGDGQLRIEIADDGVGGADLTRGSGLVGLRDRASAIGGTLAVHSPAGGGTVVMAELPCA